MPSQLKSHREPVSKKSNQNNNGVEGARWHTPGIPHQGVIDRKITSSRPARLCSEFQAILVPSHSGLPNKTWSQKKEKKYNKIEVSSSEKSHENWIRRESTQLDKEYLNPTTPQLTLLLKIKTSYPTASVNTQG